MLPCVVKNYPLWLHPRCWEASSPSFPPLLAAYPMAFFDFPLHLQCYGKGMLAKTRGIFVKTRGKTITNDRETYD